jgi:hypothetical protein
MLVRETLLGRVLVEDSMTRKKKPGYQPGESPLDDEQEQR